MANTPLEIEWHRPKPRRKKHAMRVIDKALESTEIMSNNLDLIMELGIPVPKDVKNAKELALQLLKLASEVEHALMVQYLYAANSIPRVTAGTDVDYFEKIMDVAVQEMGHLASVQNLLLLIGGPEAFYLQRDILRTGNKLNPLPFVLEPLNEESLAKYVVAEMPVNFLSEHEALMKDILKITQETGTDRIRRVGVIYEFLLWVFTPEEQAVNTIDYSQLVTLPKKPHLSDSDIFNVGIIQKFEAHREEWGAIEDDFKLQPIHSLEEARDLIRSIAEQGEGLENNKAHSHFNEFLEMFIALRTGVIKPIEIATAPTTGTHGSQQGNKIEHPYTLLWGQAFSLQYTLVILSIYHSMSSPRGAEDEVTLRSELARIALGGMRKIIMFVSQLMISLPMNSMDASNAGPPFDLDPAIFATGTTNIPADHLRLLDQLETNYQQIENSPFLNTHPDRQKHVNMLKDLRNFDKRRRNLFTPA